RSGDPSELARQLKPWLPGYLRCNGVAEGRAEPFLKYILDHLSDMGKRRFRDVLPEWLGGFAGRTGTPIDAAFVAAEAVDRVRRESRPDEPEWTQTYRAHLRRLGVASPNDLRVAPAPDELANNKALPIYQDELCRPAVRLEQEGLKQFELTRAA